MVQKEFWKNIHKILQFERVRRQQQEQYKSQQKKLKSFVSKQLKLSSKMANYMKKDDPKMQNGEAEGTGMESEEYSDSDDDKASVKIDIGLDKNGYYILEEEHQINGQKGEEGYDGSMLFDDLWLNRCL